MIVDMQGDRKHKVTWLVGTAEQEKAVPFNGLVADDFRLPELYEEQDYLASRVDSGAWDGTPSTFSLVSPGDLEKNIQEF